ncbi:MAG: hypothetical protein ACOCUS_03525 [Polyangiales bacterium]
MATVRRAEGDRLHPVVDDNGVHRFDPAEVAAEASRRRSAESSAEKTGTGGRDVGGAAADGELAAAAFALFADGKHPTEVVIQLREPPRRVALLHEQWTRMMDGVVLGPEVFSKLSRRLGRPVSRDDLGDVLCDLLDDHDKLERFTYPCCVCGEPIQAGPREWDVVSASGELADWGHGRCLESG